MLLHKSELSKIFHTTMTLKPYPQMLQDMLFWAVNIIHISLKLTKRDQALWPNICHSKARSYIKVFKEFPKCHGSNPSEI